MRSLAAQAMWWQHAGDPKSHPGRRSAGDDPFYVDSDELPSRAPA